MADKSPKSGRKWRIAGSIGVLGLVAGGYTAAYFIAGEKTPAHASVQGVGIGGLAPAEAQEKLRSQLESKYSQPVKVSDGAGHEITLEPAAAGLGVDWAKTVADAGGGASLNPIDISKTLFGGGETSVATTVDQAKLKEALAAQAETFTVPSADATLKFEGTQIVRTESSDDTALDVDSTATAIAKAYQSGEATATATITAQAPAVTSAMVDEAVRTYAEPAVSGPVTVTAGSGTFEVAPEQIAGAMSFAPEDGKLVPKIDSAKLFELTKEARAALGLNVGKNASYTMQDGAIQVVPSEDGQQVDIEALGAGVLAASAKSGSERAASVDVVQGQAEFSTEQAEKLKPTQVIGEFTTSYPHAAYRNTNIGRAAELINGAVLLPGETFSMNSRVGERTAANGFTDGYMIKDGVLVQDLGGGVSQVATTLYNAGFFAGYEDVEHKPHTLYFDRYPAGREATVVYGKLDMSFKNNTEYPAYIEGFIKPSSSGSKGSVTFRIHSIPTWEKVESSEPQKSGFYDGAERVLDTPDCKPQGAITGFTVTWQRLFYKDGAVAKTEDYQWKYSAGDRITCASKEPTG